MTLDCLVYRVRGPVSKARLIVGLREVVPGDEARMLDWQSRPEIREYSRSTEAPTAEGHKIWFAKTVADQDCRIRVITHGEAPVGVVRLDRQGHGSWEVSIYIDPDSQQLGIAGIALSLIQLPVGSEIKAFVHPDNTASQNLFRNAGFV